MLEQVYRRLFWLGRSLAVNLPKSGFIRALTALNETLDTAMDSEIRLSVAGTETLSEDGYQVKRIIVYMDILKPIEGDEA